MAETTATLVGVQELAEMLGCNPEIVEELPGSEALVRAGTPFPRPLRELEQGSLWDPADVEAWRAARRQAWRRTPVGRSL